MQYIYILVIPLILAATEHPYIPQSNVSASQQHLAIALDLLRLSHQTTPKNIFQSHYKTIKEFLHTRFCDIIFYTITTNNKHNKT